MEGTIKVLVRQSNGEQVEVECEATITVKDFKELCATKQSAIAAADMRLIFKGKILKDEMTLDDYKITDGLTIHLVKGGNKGAAATSQPAATASADAGAAGASGASAGAGLSTGPSGGAGGANPFASMGMGMPGMGMGGMPPMGGMGGPGGGMPNPQMMEQMMSNPMVQ